MKNTRELVVVPIIGTLVGLVYYYLYVFYLPSYFISHGFKVIQLTQHLKGVLLFLFIVLGIMERALTGIPAFSTRIVSKLTGSIILLVIMNTGLLVGELGGLPTVLNIRGLLIVILITSTLIGLIDGLPELYPTYSLRTLLLSRKRESPPK